METELYDEKINWELYLTRPFSIFGASLWYLWYHSDKIKKILGTDLPDGLYIEEHPGLAKSYKMKTDLERFNKAMEFTVKDISKCEKLLDKGKKLNEETQKIIKVGPSYFKNLSSAVDFLVDLAVHSTVFPYWAYSHLGELKMSEELRKKAEDLRAISYYPDFVNKIVLPLAKKHLEKLGVKNAKDILDSIHYAPDKVNEIVEIISIHDADQLENTDVKKVYDSENKKMFHDIDCMDRYNAERLKKMAKTLSDKDKMFAMLSKGLDSFFYPEFRKIAEEKFRNLNI